MIKAKSVDVVVVAAAVITELIVPVMVEEIVVVAMVVLKVVVVRAVQVTRTVVNSSCRGRRRFEPTFMHFLLYLQEPLGLISLSMMYNFYQLCRLLDGRGEDGFSVSQ